MLRQLITQPSSWDLTAAFILPWVLRDAMQAEPREVDDGAVTEGGSNCG